jgi:hypothetical protein
MNKKLIRLTEGDLHRIVKESVNKILKEVSSYELEGDWRNDFASVDFGGEGPMGDDMESTIFSLPPERRNDVFVNDKDAAFKYGDDPSDVAYGFPYGEKIAKAYGSPKTYDWDLHSRINKQYRDKVGSNPNIR